MRELENVIERGTILARQGRLRLDLPDTTPPDARPAAAPIAEQVPTGEVLTESDRRARDRRNILAALEASNGRIFGPGGAAERLDVKPTTLASRLKALGIKAGRRSASI